MTTNKLNYLQKRQLNDIQYLKSKLDARKTLVESAYMRHMILEKQKIANYTNEYQRIRAHLENSALPFQTKEQIKNRTEQLKKMGARITEGIV